jgi:hypothetical protein
MSKSYSLFVEMTDQKEHIINKLSIEQVNTFLTAMNYQNNVFVHLKDTSYNIKNMTAVTVVKEREVDDSSV